MRRMVKYLFRMFIFLALGYVAYAIFGDLPPPTRERVVTLPPPETGP